MDFEDDLRIGSQPKAGNSLVLRISGVKVQLFCSVRIELTKKIVMFVLFQGSIWNSDCLEGGFPISAIFAIGFLIPQSLYSFL